VVLGVAAGTAVLVGALLVGDSVRGSLRGLVLDRLAAMDHLLVSDRYFRAELKDALMATGPGRECIDLIAPAIVIPSCAVELTSGPKTARSTQVLLLGLDDSFWRLGPGGPRPATPIEEGEIVLNQPLADDLGARVGDEIVVRLPSGDGVSADSPLGRRSDRIRSLAQLKVKQIIPAAGLGRFDLRSTQHLPRNAYLPLQSIQSELRLDGRINALLVAGKSAEFRTAETARRLSDALPLSLDDFGLRLQRVSRTFPGADGQPRTIQDCFQLTTDRLLLSDEVAAAAIDCWHRHQPQAVMTYLAMSISRAVDPDRKIPVSLITGVDSTAELGPLQQADGMPLSWKANNELVLNSWAASDLRAEKGDRIIASYFEPETTHGEPVLTSREFTLADVVALTEPVRGYDRKTAAEFDRPPTRANDPDLTPTVEGFTDQQTIDDWDPPFPYDKRSLRPQDDEYWNRHRTTPKAFLPLAAAREYFGSRFGATTSIRVPARNVEQVELERQLLAELRERRIRMALEFQPIKARSLASSAGTTPFDLLFLGLSFFLIASALMLVGLLFRLGMERRAREFGTLIALGLSRSILRRIWMGESIGLAGAGGVLGATAGVGYAWLMLVGLRSWWLGAVSTPFLELHVTVRSLLIGASSGAVLSIAVIAWTVRGLGSVTPRRLLAGSMVAPTGDSTTGAAAGPKLAAGVFLLAAVSGVAATRLAGEAQAGAFVGAGALVLVACLILLRWRLRQSASLIRLSRFSLPALAADNIRRKPGRSALIVGLISSATFLIVAMSAFRLDPRSSGSGGYDLIGIASQPIFEDLNLESVRQERFGAQAAGLRGTVIHGLRFKPGDDASCNNLYKPSQPRVIGVTAAFRDFFDQPAGPSFGWAAHETMATAAPSAPSSPINPWRLLFSSRSGDAIPVVIDKNTAMYSLQLYGGVGELFTLAYDGRPPVTFRVVGLLSNSVLQGSLIVSEPDFVRAFPDVTGYRFFLVQAAEGRRAEVASLLEESLGDQGLDVRATADVLTDLLAVQNTYLSTFQSLGALGLLLGTLGVAAAQLRNILERIAEFAVLRATGFTNRRIALLIGLEHSIILLLGLGVGLLAAIVAVAPHAVAGGASVPWRDLSWMFAAVVVVGLGTGLTTVREALRPAIVSALRSD
jgi:ABC-type antimicrobial peptide transport system permease subunit